MRKLGIGPLEMSSASSSKYSCFTCVFSFGFERGGFGKAFLAAGQMMSGGQLGSIV